jgi:hypothetical protein
MYTNDDSILATEVSNAPIGHDRNSLSAAVEDLRSSRGGEKRFPLEVTKIPDLEAVKAKQKVTWESGDFGQIAHTIENAAEEFMAGQSVRPALRSST